jgi:hypothetical protein
MIGFETMSNPTALPPVRATSAILYLDQSTKTHSRNPRTSECMATPISVSPHYSSQFQSLASRSGAKTSSGTTHLEIVSGGHFKATRHRVFSPPVDQLQEERLSIVQFQSSVGHLRMTPAIESPLIQREGCIEDQGVYREFKRVMDLGFPVSKMV